MSTAAIPSLAGWYLAALGISLTLVPLCRAFATRTGYVARPRQDRWHRRPTALFGGVAIALAVLPLATLGGDFQRLAILVAGGALMFGVGFADDMLSFKPSTKLIAEIAVASMFVVAGERLHWSDQPAVDMLLTLVWLVGVTNAFNLLDNMDGLCAGIALIAGVALLGGLAGRTDVWPEARYIAILLGATSGFLVYNIHPASIFMGDAGSLFLGMSLAGLTLTVGGPAHDRSRILSIVVAPMLVLLIPIFDTTLVTVSRLLSGRPISRGGRDHSSHRLVAIGLSERSAVRVLWVLAAAAGVIGFFVRQFADDRALLVSAMFLIAMVVFAVYLAQVRVYSEPSPFPLRGVTPLVIEFMHKRRVAEVLLDVCLVSIAYYAAWRLRFEGAEWVPNLPTLLQSLPIAVTVQLTALFVFGAYRGLWRYFGLMDGVVFAKSVVGGTTGIVLAIASVYGLEGYSRGVFVMYAALLMLLLCTTRASFRLIGEFIARRASGPRLIVYTSGARESRAARDMIATFVVPARIVGFISDEPQRAMRYVQGYPVLGGYDELITFVNSGLVDEVLVCVAGLDPARLEHLRAHCESCRVRVSQLRYNLEPVLSAERPAVND